MVPVSRFDTRAWRVTIDWSPSWKSPREIRPEHVSLPPDVLVPGMRPAVVFVAVRFGKINTAHHRALATAHVSPPVGGPDEWRKLEDKLAPVMERALEKLCELSVPDEGSEVEFVFYVKKEPSVDIPAETLEIALDWSAGQRKRHETALERVRAATPNPGFWERHSPDSISVWLKTRRLRGVQTHLVYPAPTFAEADEPWNKQGSEIRNALYGIVKQAMASLYAVYFVNNEAHRRKLVAAGMGGMLMLPTIVAGAPRKVALGDDRQHFGGGRRSMLYEVAEKRPQ